MPRGMPAGRARKTGTTSSTTEGVRLGTLGPNGNITNITLQQWQESAKYARDIGVLPATVNLDRFAHAMSGFFGLPGGGERTA